MHFDEGATADGKLAGVNPAVIRQQMGHATAAMTHRISKQFGTIIELLEKTEEMENATAA